MRSTPARLAVTFLPLPVLRERAGVRGISSGISNLKSQTEEPSPQPSPGVPGEGVGEMTGGPPVDPRLRRLRLVAMISVLALFFLVIPGLNRAGVIPDYKLNVLG